MLPKNSNFDYMIGPKVRNINRLFVLSFKNGENDPKTNYFHSIPLKEILINL